MLSLQDKGKNLKNFNFHNNADEMGKKSVFETANFYFFFPEKEVVTVNDVRDIGYVRRNNRDFSKAD